MSTGDEGDDPPKPARPDPFAPLPLADLPPVRRRGPPDPVEQSRRARTASDRPSTKTTKPDEPEPTERPTTPNTRAASPASERPTTLDTRTASAPPAPAGMAEVSPAPEPALSWTDMPAPQGSSDQAPTAGELSSSPGPDASGSLSWTDLGSPIAPPSSPTAPSPLQAAEPPLVPTTSSDNELRAAVGAPPIPDKPTTKRRRAPTDGDDDDGGDGGAKPRSRKAMLFGALTLVVGGGIAAMVILGKVNSERYLITCKADRVVVEQGRTFPPWGETSLDGAEWKALKIPPEAPCNPYETEDKAELAAHYFQVLRDHATTLLTAREVTKIDDAEAQLKQALLVARSLRVEDDRIDARDEIERLLGDVVYWRASAKLRSASDALVEAAKQFDLAASQRPRHVTDAAAWALYVRKLVEQLRAGPAGAAQSTFPPLPPGERPLAPPGVALPVEPGAGSTSGSAAEPVTAPPADAGLPTGGVLL